MSYADYAPYASSLGPDYEPPAPAPSIIALGGSDAQGHGCDPGFGSMWANRVYPPAVIRADLLTGATIVIPFGDASTDEIRNVVCSAAVGVVAAANYKANKVHIIDPATNEECATLSCEQPYGLAFDLDGNLIVCECKNPVGTVKKFAPASKASWSLVAAQDVGNLPMFPGLKLGADGVIGVPCFYSNNFWRLALSDLSVLSTWGMGTYPYEAQWNPEIERWLITENGARLTTPGGGSRLLAFNELGDSAACYLPASSGPAGHRSIPGGPIVVCLSLENRLAIVSTGLVIQSYIATEPHCSRLALDPLNLTGVVNVNAEPPATLQRHSIE